MANHRDLDVWHRAVGLTASCYISANIAEGCGRATTAGFIRFLHIARGSHGELDSHFETTRVVGFLDDTDYSSLSDEHAAVGRMLGALINALERKQGPR